MDASSDLSQLHISVNQHGNPVNTNASTPVVNFNKFLEELHKNVNTQTQSLIHRSLDPNRIYYLNDGTRSRYGVIEYLTWVSKDNVIGEKISDEHLEKICRSYTSRASSHGSGRKRKTRKTRRSRK
jgi:hypothetical protein